LFLNPVQDILKMQHGNGWEIDILHELLQEDYSRRQNENDVKKAQVSKSLMSDAASKNPISGASVKENR